MLSDDQATDAVNSAIKEYSKYRPLRNLDSLTTIALQAGYPLTAKQRILRVTDVFYSTLPMYPFQGFWGEMADLGRLEGLSVFENPSLWVQYMQRFEKYKEIFDGDFSFDESSKLLTLIPTPQTAGTKVYYIWTQRHTALTIPEDEYDRLMIWGKGDSKEMMSGKLGTQISSVSGYGESVSFGASSASLSKEGSDLKERFRKSFGTTVISVG
jgi:hypothetical protein